MCLVFLSLCTVLEVGSIPCLQMCVALILDACWFSDSWSKDRCRVCEFNSKYHDHFTLGYRSFIERAEVLIKELVRNKINSSFTFRHYSLLRG